MEHPKAVGDRTTLAVIVALTERGFSLSIPFGENTRYDLIVDHGDRLSRVQCKTGRLRKGAIRFAVCSSYGHHRNPQNSRRHYQGQIDDFAIYCPETTGVYVVPISDLPVRTQGALRIEPARNNQTQHVRFASDYEIARVACVRSAGSAQAALAIS